MTPSQAKLLVEGIDSIHAELEALRFFLENSIDRIVVALSSVAK